MTRTQIQLPDDLYRRAKAFAAERELSLAEITRRGIELFLDRFPPGSVSQSGQQLPCVDGRGIQVPLERLHDFSAEDEILSGFPQP